MSNARVTQQYAEAAIEPGERNARVTQQYVEAAIEPGDRNARVTQQYVEVAYLEILPAEVSTLAATDVTPTSATLNGELTSLGGYSTVDVHFEWRAAGSGTWLETTPETLIAIGLFSAGLVSLVSGTTYEFRSVVVFGSEEAYGSVLSFGEASTGPVLYIGSQRISRVYVGTQEISKIVVGGP